MKIRIEKTYTAPYQMDRVKAEISEFKAMYTEQDILNHFRAETESCEQIPHYFDILHYDIKAFPSGWMYNDINSYCVEMVLTDTGVFSRMIKIRFYINQNFEINLDPDMYSVIEFRPI